MAVSSSSQGLMYWDPNSGQPPPQARDNVSVAAPQPVPFYGADGKLIGTGEPTVDGTFRVVRPVSNKDVQAVLGYRPPLTGSIDRLDPGYRAYVKAVEDYNKNGRFSNPELQKRLEDRVTVGYADPSRRMENGSVPVFRMENGKIVNMEPLGFSDPKQWEAPPTPEQVAEEQEVAKKEEAQAGVTQKINEFYDLMMAPWDDPRWAPQRDQIVGNTVGAVNRDSYGRGLSGPAAGDRAAYHTANALVAGMGQRQALGAQGLGLMNSRDLGLSQLDLSLKGLEQQGRQFDMGLDLQMQQAQAAARQGRGSLIGSLVGGGLGVAASLIPGVGWAAAPGLIAAGTSLGGGLGAGIGAGGGPSMSRSRYWNPTSGGY